ncbi:MAG TPA: 16S rRNA (adenine(1518)-N(6)/adenine(1519)-N(6))-dimethyltransferase RsmA [candidate division Zixibacteria bacterium]|nr:16S rRNA (adenine(1518)-N(6)/adenine(1519)-N(6))-dimethyltransferase RsmA [candidate division Zixibacteria bacterium]
MPKKSLGQNFLINKSIQKKIVSFLDLLPSDLVLEIGAGKGAMTVHLAESGAKLWAVEVDKKILPELQAKLEPYSNAQVLPQAIQSVRLLDLEPAGKFKIAGNIPYHLTSPILDWLVLQKERIERAVIMIQREVARRAMAGPKTSEYSPLTFFVRFHFEVEKLLDVGPGNFYPKPKVNSTVVKLIPRPEVPWGVESPEKFFEVVKKAFLHRRKTLLNSLVLEKVASAEKLGEIFEAVGIPAKARPEDLDFLDFARLANQLLTSR